jgi:hypothetical protein
MRRISLYWPTLDLLASQHSSACDLELVAVVSVCDGPLRQPANHLPADISFEGNLCVVASAVQDFVHFVSRSRLGSGLDIAVLGLWASYSADRKAGGNDTHAFTIFQGYSERNSRHSIT